MPVRLSEDQIRDAAELWETRREIRALEAKAEELRKRILQTLGGESQGVTASGLVAVEVTIQNRTGVDSHKLRAMHPQVWQDVLRQTEATLVSLPLGAKARKLVFEIEELPDDPNDEVFWRG